MDEMIKRWRAYLQAIPDYRNKQDYSDVWEDLIKNFEIKENELSDIAKLVKKKCRGYNFERLDPRTANFYNRIIFLRGGFLYVIKRIYEKFIKYPAQKFNSWVKKRVTSVIFLFARERIYDYHLFDKRSIRLLKYLNHRSINVEMYLKPLTNQGKFILTYNTLKAVHFFDLIIKKCGLNNKNDSSIFEIGAGTANLAILFGSHSICKNYYIVDLPEMLLLASYELFKYLPNANQILPTEIGSKKQIDLHPLKTNFILLAPDQISLIPENAIDLVINIESFGEMEQSVANEYIKSMYHVLRKNGFLFTANRESRVVSEVKGVSNFTTYWKYTFLNSDDVILQEYCPMRDFVMGEKARNINRLAQKKI